METEKQFQERIERILKMQNLILEDKTNEITNSMLEELIEDEYLMHERYEDYERYFIPDNADEDERKRYLYLQYLYDAGGSIRLKRSPNKRKISTELYKLVAEPLIEILEKHEESKPYETSVPIVIHQAWPLSTRRYPFRLTKSSRKQVNPWDHNLKTKTFIKELKRSFRQLDSYLLLSQKIDKLRSSKDELDKKIDELYKEKRKIFP
ncbi:hypothetical protein KY348_06120 [Candidatus Woesearchaeota archaeon]|nr:hypothetical protein [Candidatus Woesearchaeota archaeon]